MHTLFTWKFILGSSLKSFWIRLLLASMVVHALMYPYMLEHHTQLLMLRPNLEYHGVVSYVSSAHLWFTAVCSAVLYSIPAWTVYGIMRFFSAKQIGIGVLFVATFVAILAIAMMAMEGKREYYSQRSFTVAEKECRNIGKGINAEVVNGRVTFKCVEWSEEVR